jgi:diguanylate cyclase
MAALLAVLLFLRKRHSTIRIDNWLYAFGFIIITTTVSSLPRTESPMHLVYHLLELYFEMLTCLAFVYAAEMSHASGKLRDSYLLWNGPAMLALMLVYGWYISTPWVYAVIIAVGVVAACFSLLSLPGRRLTALYQLGVWIYAAFLLHMQGHLYDHVLGYIYLRRLTYSMLCFAYILAAVTCLTKLPKRSIGKITIATGMLIWAACSALHSWSITQPAYRTLVDQTWDMQKFLIATGLLLFLLEEQLASTQWLALHDQLTGLANRYLLEDRLRHAIATAHRAGTGLTVFLFDLNGFKNINDTYGHRAGDLLLKHITTTLQASLRETDTLARMGGDEFVLIAPGMQELPGIERLSRFILDSIAAPLDFTDHKTLSITGSIGYAVYPKDVLKSSSEDPSNQLLDLADRRMYALKHEQADRII